MAGWATAASLPVGSHSNTRPGGFVLSSQDSHAPHGAGPPAQLRFDPERIRYARWISPSGSNSTADTPPVVAISELDTRIHPPSGAPPASRGKVAWPSV